MGQSRKKKKKKKQETRGVAECTSEGITTTRAGHNTVARSALDHHGHQGSTRETRETSDPIVPDGGG